MPVIFTVGHSIHPLDYFVGLLEKHRISAVADVRSSPHSRRNPQFNREELTESLGQHGIRYVFLGDELGARSGDPSCYAGGQVQFDRLACTALFRSGIERLTKGAADHRIALVCAEKEPLECHRTVLVSRHLIANGVEVQHIHADGLLELHVDTMRRLVESLRMSPADLFKTDDAIDGEAYARQAVKIAYRKPAGSVAAKRTSR